MIPFAVVATYEKTTFMAKGKAADLYRAISSCGTDLLRCDMV